MQVENYTSLLEEIVITTKDLCDSEELQDTASRLQVKYMQVIEKFARCHKGYSTSEMLIPDEVDTLGEFNRKLCS